MNYWKFLLYTTIGAGVWNCILAALGWYLYSVVPEDKLAESIHQYGEYIKWGLIVIVVAVAVFFTAKYFYNKSKANK